MEGTRRYRKFDKEFKLEAVRLVAEGGRGVAEVARSLDVHENLCAGGRASIQMILSGVFPGKGHLKPEEEELRRLRRENESLKETMLY